MHACVRAYVRACVRARVRVCVRACVCACVLRAWAVRCGAIAICDVYDGRYLEREDEWDLNPRVLSEAERKAGLLLCFFVLCVRVCTPEVCE